MDTCNRYPAPMRLERSRLSDKQTKRLLERFVAGTPARTAAELAQVNRNTARVFYHRLREIIAQQLVRVDPVGREVDAEDIELVDAPDTGLGRTAAREIPLFGLLQRGDKVYAVMLSTPQRPLLGERPRVPGHVAANHRRLNHRNNNHTRNHHKTRLKIDALVYAAVPELGAALNFSDLRQLRGARRAASRDLHQIDRIDDFWDRMKWHLRRFNGVPRQHFYLFLKECEWRYNYGTPERLSHTLMRWIEEQELTTHTGG